MTFLTILKRLSFHSIKPFARIEAICAIVIIAMVAPMAVADEGSFMAKRADARQVVVVQGASHMIMISHASDVEKIIENAAAGSR